MDRDKDDEIEDFDVMINVDEEDVWPYILI